jgi:hypothetical protein
VASLAGRAAEAGGRVQTLPALVTGGALLALGLARLLPAEGAGLALRLAVAAFLVLLLPGWLVLRPLGLPGSFGVAVAASFAVSLALVLVSLGVLFLVGSSLAAALVALAVVVVAALATGVWLGPRRAEVPVDARADRRAGLAVLGASIPLVGLVWWSAGPIGGDLLFHLARMRKLAEFDALPVLGSVNEFQDGSLHPGYAFPLWHGAVAMIARIAGVDVVDVALYLPAILVPLAVVLAYGAGTAVFRRPAGGVVLVVAQVAQLALSGAGGRAGTGVFELLASPPTTSRVLLAPTVLALAFTVVERRSWPLVGALAASALALSVIHPSYTPYVALLLGGFLFARLVVVRALDPLVKRAALALAAVTVPFVLYLAWLYPVVADDPSTRPTAARRDFEIQHYGNAFDFFGDSFRFAPEAIARGGPVVVAGLLAIPLAGFAARRRWAQLVLGGSLFSLALLLVPQLFTLLSDVFSVSQARRLSAFLPLAFALAGAFVLAGRARLAGVALAFGAGLAAELLVSGEFTYRVQEGGPGWVVWVATAGALVALAVGAFLRPRGPEPGRWAVLAAGAFALPVAVAGLADVERQPDPNTMPDETVAAVRAITAPGDVVFSDATTAYRIAAYTPVYVNAAPTGHVAFSTRNRPRRRRIDSERFFLVPGLTDYERGAILSRYDADWVLVDRELRHPEDYLDGLRLVYDGGRYALYAAPSRG